jgi:hypothetical protein
MAEVFSPRTKNLLWNIAKYKFNIFLKSIYIQLGPLKFRNFGTGCRVASGKETFKYY